MKVSFRVALQNINIYIYIVCVSTWSLLIRGQKKPGPRPDRSPLRGLIQNSRRASPTLSYAESPPGISPGQLPERVHSSYPDIICVFLKHEIEAQSPSAHRNREIMKHFSLPFLPFSFSPLYSPGWRARVYPWAFHKLLEIFQKVSCNFSKSCPKVAKKKNQKLLEKTKTFFGLKLKYANSTTN